MNYSKLKGRIIEKFGSQEAFAKKIERSVVSVSKKMNGKSSFTRNDIILWAKELDIPVSEIGDYFFCQESLVKLN